MDNSSNNKHVANRCEDTKLVGEPIDWKTCFEAVISNKHDQRAQVNIHRFMYDIPYDGVSES